VITSPEILFYYFSIVAHYFEELREGVQGAGVLVDGQRTPRMTHGEDAKGPGQQVRKRGGGRGMEQVSARTIKRHHHHCAFHPTNHV
jgi:hypothetical protein